MLVEIWVKMGQKVTVESHSMVQKSVKNSLFFLTISLSKVGENGSKHNQEWVSNAVFWSVYHGKNFLKMAQKVHRMIVY